MGGPNCGCARASATGEACPVGEGCNSGKRRGVLFVSRSAGGRPVLLVGKARGEVGWRPSGALPPDKTTDPEGYRQWLEGSYTPPATQTQYPNAFDNNASAIDSFGRIVNLAGQVVGDVVSKDPPGTGTRTPTTVNPNNLGPNVAASNAAPAPTQWTTGQKAAAAAGVAALGWGVFELATMKPSRR